MMRSVRSGNRFKRPSAVVFDWAGTAVDYGCIGPVAAFVEVFANAGVEITLEEAREPMGLMKKDHIRAILEMESVRERWQSRHGQPPAADTIDTLYENLEPMLIATVAEYAYPIPGMIELCDELRERGIKIGSSTGYTTPIMERLVPAAADLGFLPDAVVSSSDVPGGRPNPWMCYLNAMKLNVYPMASMVKIGDTVSDIKAGVNAGMWTVGVVASGNMLGLNEEQLQSADPSAVAARTAAGYRELTEAGAHYVIDGVWEALPVIEQIEERLKAGERP